MGNEGKGSISEVEQNENLYWSNDLASINLGHLKLKATPLQFQ